MFEPTTHPFVGTTRMFMPQGKSPYQIETADPKALVICNGDAVTVESAWTRPYLARTAPTLLYVRSHRTGLATHVIESEVKLELPLKIKSGIWKLDALVRAGRDGATAGPHDIVRGRA